MSDESTRLRAVVTGASSGIGEATVRLLRAKGWDVVAAARRRDRLEALAAQTGAQAVQLDVTDADSVAAAVEAISSTGPVNSLVNNAGGAFGLGPLEEADIDDYRAMYEVNVLGTARMTKALLPAIRATGRGDVLFVDSTASHGTYPGGAGYVAAKHAERALALTLRLELQWEPVRVLSISPGAVETEFSLKRFGGDADRAAKVYEGFTPLTAEDVADAIVWMLTRPHHVNVDDMILRPIEQASFFSPKRSQ